MSAIQLHNPMIFYTSKIDKCFWCKDPCCRIDLFYEAFLCRDCEAAVIEDMNRFSQA